MTARKTYLVVGDSRVAGHAKGETFQHIYREHEEQALIEGGHIQVVRRAFHTGGRRAEKREESHDG